MNDLFFDNRIAGLISKFLQEDISEAEYQELQAWAGASDRAREIFDELTSEEKLPVALANYSGVRERVLTKIHAAEPETRVVETGSGFRWTEVQSVKKTNFVRYMYVAAAIVVLASVSLLYWITGRSSNENSKTVKNPTVNHYGNDVLPPTGTQAKLIISGGEEINLDGGDALIIKQGDAEVKKNGVLLSYNDIEGNENAVYHTLKTEKGGFINLRLADSTTVWLNALSSITFPTKFSSKIRDVKVSGEVFFSVAPNKKMPFVVEVGNMKVEVVGTSFAINCYEDEPTKKTTLIEGVVKINKAQHIVTLRPGQQAELSDKESEPIMINEHPNIEEMVGWKEGLFYFQDTPLENIMRQVARKYDVEVEFESKFDKHFSFILPRDVPLSRLLKLIELTETVHFKIEGKKVFVSQ